MGGSGSGRWDGHRKKRAVEACQCVSIRELKEAGILRAKPPEWRWKGILPEPFLWDERVIWPERDWPLVQLPDGSMVGIEEWRPRFGGASWWFHCANCDRRCLKLYRPPGQHWFYCRQCHRLTYISSQEAHRWDRGAFIGILCAMTGTTPRELEKVMRADFKAQREAYRWR